MDMIEKVAEVLKAVREANIARPLSECYESMARAAIETIEGLSEEAVDPEEMRAFRAKLSQSAASGEVVDAVVKGNALMGSLSK